MRRITLVISTVLLTFMAQSVFAADCIPKRELRDKHVFTYRAYNNTTRGCIVTAKAYTSQHKKGRGNRSRKYIIEVCEGEPRTSPRIGNSFEICRHVPKPVKPVEED